LRLMSIASIRAAIGEMCSYDNGGAESGHPSQYLSAGSAAVENLSEKGYR